MVVVWGWRVQSGLVMNIHVVFHVLPNRKWHHRGRLHPSKNGGSGWAGGRKGRRKQTGTRKNRESQGKVMEDCGKWRQTERVVGDQAEWQGSIR